MRLQRNLLLLLSFHVSIADLIDDMQQRVDTTSESNGFDGKPRQQTAFKSNVRALPKLSEKSRTRPMHQSVETGSWCF